MREWAWAQEEADLSFEPGALMEAIFIQGLKRKVTDTTVRDSKDWKDLKKNAIANDRRKKIEDRRRRDTV